MRLRVEEVNGRGRKSIYSLNWSLYNERFMLKIILCLQNIEWKIKKPHYSHHDNWSLILYYSDYKIINRKQTLKNQPKALAIFHQIQNISNHSSIIIARKPFCNDDDEWLSAAQRLGRLADWQLGLWSSLYVYNSFSRFSIAMHWLIICAL